MTIQLNGQPFEIEDGASVSRLLEVLDFSSQRVLAEVNGKALLASEQAGTVLHAGDRVELVRIVAGG
ncbi:MAG: sulfur carrier protein ThiS [Verrucomicrobiales bacterium]|nr:sulfur carrier protein ThiS [Verrucomicrobiales bacterium]